MGGGFAEPRTQVLRRLSVVPVGHQSAVAWILKAMHSFLQRPDNLAAWSLACLFAAVNRDPWTRTLYVASPRLPGSSDGTLTRHASRAAAAAAAAAAVAAPLRCGVGGRADNRFCSRMRRCAHSQHRRARSHDWIQCCCWFQHCNFSSTRCVLVLVVVEIWVGAGGWRLRGLRWVTGRCADVGRSTLSVGQRTGS